MTGAYLRTKRDDRWQNIEVDQLTDAELDQLERDQGLERGWVWAKFLSKWIRENVKDQNANENKGAERETRLTNVETPNPLKPNE